MSSLDTHDEAMEIVFRQTERTQQSLSKSLVSPESIKESILPHQYEIEPQPNRFRE